MDKVTPQDWTTYLQHTMEDVVPAVFCCKGTFTNCGSYQQKRPIDDGSRSPPPPPVPGGQYTTVNDIGHELLLVYNIKYSNKCTCLLTALLYM